jgi:hypothetical protein
VDAEMFAIARMFGGGEGAVDLASSAMESEADRAEAVKAARARFNRARKRLNSMTGAVVGGRMEVRRSGKLVRNGIRSVRAAEREMKDAKAILTGYGEVA